MADPTVERWLPVPGYEGRYEVSDHGRVMSLRADGRSRNCPREMRTGIGNHGYRTVMLFADGRSSRFLVHRLVALAFIGPCPEGIVVRHLDGDRLNNWVENLAYGTYADNVEDQRCHGTHPSQWWADVCKNGHVKQEVGVMTLATTGRTYCRQCRRERNREYKARLRARRM